MELVYMIMEMGLNVKESTKEASPQSVHSILEIV